jgi:transposase InsO family protein
VPQPASPLSHRVRRESTIPRALRAAGWQLERVLSDNGNEFGRRSFADRLPPGVAHTRIRSGRPQTNGHVEPLQRTILEECRRPAFARFLQVRYSGLKRHLDSYLRYYNHERAHTGRITRGRTPTELIYPGHKMTPR